MRKFKFAGDGPVDVPALGLVDVAPETVVEVVDPAVADGFEGSAVWVHIPDPKRSRAAKKAAATRADNDNTEES